MAALQQVIASYAVNGSLRTVDPTYKKYASHLRGQHIAIEGILGAGKSTLGAALEAYLKSVNIQAQFRGEVVPLKLLQQFYEHQAANSVDDGETVVTTTASATSTTSCVVNADTIDAALAANLIPVSSATPAASIAKNKPVRPTNPYALSMQIFMLSICQKNNEEALWFTGQRAVSGCHGVAFTERTVFGNAVFAALQYQMGALTKADFNAYEEILTSQGPYTTNAVLYLHVPVDIAMFRVQRMRRRDSERTVDRSYLAALETAYYTQIYYQMQANHTYVIVISNEAYYDAPQVLNLLCAAPPAYQFAEAENPLMLKEGQAGEILNKMCKYYEAFMR